MAVTPAQELAIVAAYQGGDSLFAIAERVGMHKTGVRKLLLRHGVTLRRRGWAKGRARK